MQCVGRAEMIAPKVAPLCPGDSIVDCDTTLGDAASVITAVSGVPSLFLSALVVYSHLRAPETVIGSRTIVTYIATANVVASAGYVMGAVNYQTHRSAQAFTVDCNGWFLPACQVQGFVTCMAAMMSQIWTVVLTIHLYRSVVMERCCIERRLILLCHVIAWGLPTLVSFGLLWSGQFGYSTVTSSSWCFIADANYDNASPKPTWVVIVLVFVGDEFVKLFTFVVVVTCVALVKCRKQPIQPQHKSERRLLLVPVMVLMMRVWGTLYVLSSLVDPQKICTDQYDIFRSLISILGVLQAICDPGGTGWGSMVVYLLCSPQVCRQFWNDLCTCSGLGTRWCTYRGRRPSAPGYFFKNSPQRSSAVMIYAAATPTKAPCANLRKNAGHFQVEETESADMESNSH